MQVTDMKLRSTELATRLRGVADEAVSRGVTISQLLEDEDPTYEYAPEDRGIDAFGRVLRELKIRTMSIPEMGIKADMLEVFGRNDQTQTAFSEWLARRMREASMGAKARMQQRAVYTSADQAVGTTLNQISFDMEPYFLQVAPAVPIEEVVAKTTTITGGTYMAYFLTDVLAQKRFTRVPENTEIPAVKLSGGNHALKVRKFGRRLDATYEQLRRMPIDLLALHIQRMMVQAEVDKLAAIIDVIVNGDASGAGNSATVYALTALDPAISSPSVAALTLKAYLTFKAKFRNPYQVTTMLGNENAVVATQTLSTGSANIPLVVLQNLANQPYGGSVPINNELADMVRIGLTDDAPSNKIIGIDKRFAVERIVEAGSDITESTRWVQRQVQSLMMTFDETYAIIDQNAVKIMDCAS